MSLARTYLLQTSPEPVQSRSGEVLQQSGNVSTTRQQSDRCSDDEGNEESRQSEKEPLDGEETPQGRRDVHHSTDTEDRGESSRREVTNENR